MLSIYQKLFITQSALCELSIDYELTSSFELVLTPVAVYLVSVADQDERDSSSESNELRNDLDRLTPNFEFFSDQNNFFGTTADDVQRLLGNFWKRFERFSGRDQALLVFGLDEDADQREIKVRYKELASVHHPDRGGDAKEFIRLREAYEVLKR